ncbi:DNA (cytosine-5-)-methyltransferase, partial [Fusarium beomiforme]
MPLFDLTQDDNLIDLTLDDVENPNTDWFSNHNDNFDDVFEDAFVPRDPNTITDHDAPKMWTKFGEMEEEEERMSVMEQVDLSPGSPAQSPPNYGLSPEDLFEGIESDMSDMPDIPKWCLMTPDPAPDFGNTDAGASAEVLQQEDATREKTPDAPLIQNLTVEFPESLLLVPRSYYEPFELGVLILREREAVAQLFEVAKQAGQDIGEFVEFQLDDFAVYSDRQTHEQEMCPLHHLHTKHGYNNIFFDGKLSVGNTVFYVCHVEISALLIENYGTLSKHTVRDKIWIRSELNSEREMYYRLNRPAKEYRRFFDPFLWVADLA